MKWRLYFFILIILFAGGAVHAQSAKQYFKIGDEYLKKSKFEEAIEQYGRAIDLDPDYEKALLQRARTYERLEKYEAAIADYESAIVFNEKDPEIYYASGRLYYKRGDYYPALERLDRAIVLKGNYQDALIERAKVNVALGRYMKALNDTKKALRLDATAEIYYNHARVLELLEMYDEAEIAYRESINKERDVVETHFALANMLYSIDELDEAFTSLSYVLVLDPRHLEGLLLKSQIYALQKNYPKAIEVLSLVSIDYPNDTRIYLARGDYYMILNQITYAINDFSRVMLLDPKFSKAYYRRAAAYEVIRDYKKARADYETLLEMSKYDGEAQRLFDEVTERIFELNRENNRPVVTLIEPLSNEDHSVDVPDGIKVLAVTGIITEESEVKSLKVNSFTVPVKAVEGGYEFLATVNVQDLDQITVQVSDIYENAETVIFPVRRTEVDPPTVMMIRPYASENNILYLASQESEIYLEGRVEDASKIARIYIDSVMASYVPSDLNPSFMAQVDVEKKTKISVQVEDIYGNTSSTEFSLNRDAQFYSETPMGKTWVVFIENSKYSSFASLQGPSKDVSLMREALSRYQIHNTIHKSNMTKYDLQKFFSIELRDLIKSNHVKSILIWYAGHGKFINETGYWIPVDASRDEEISFYSTNQLKASMQTYSKELKHTLVVTDACESGPSFYQAMRSDVIERDCNDWQATSFKSSQVFSSAGYELAADDSQFTRTFASILTNSPEDCVPIESIVLKVSTIVGDQSQQKPQFGKIEGLEDEDGTFFFIPKSY